RIKAAIAELDALRRAPAPSDDIEARVQDYLRGLAPKVRGVGVGERLSIVWPGAQGGNPVHIRTYCRPAGAAGRAVSRPNACPRHGRGRAHGQRPPVPVAQRAPRVAALERELDELHRVEGALVAAAIATGTRRLRRPRQCWASGLPARFRAPPDHNEDAAL